MGKLNVDGTEIQVLQNVIYSKGFAPFSYLKDIGNSSGAAIFLDFFNEEFISYIYLKRLF